MQWISTKDRLPKDHDKILFYSKEDLNIHSGYYLESDFYDWSNFIWDTTYWMPLPELPKEESWQELANE